MSPAWYTVSLINYESSQHFIVIQCKQAIPKSDILHQTLRSDIQQLQIRLAIWMNIYWVLHLTIRVTNITTYSPWSALSKSIYIEFSIAAVHVEHRYALGTPPPGSCTRADTWSSISDSKGETTTDIPGHKTAGSWKHKLCGKKILAHKGEWFAYLLRPVYLSAASWHNHKNVLIH